MSSATSPPSGCTSSFHAGRWMRPRDYYGTNVRVKREIHAEFSRPFDVREAIDNDPLIVEMRASLGIISMLVPEIS